MNITVEVLIIVACIVGLWKGAELVVDSATRIARKLGMSDLIIGLTVVAIGTSAPEFAVTAVAAINGQADISVGNVVGSNIFNLGFILGGLALFKGIATSKQIVFRDGGMLIGVTLLLVFFLRDLAMARWEGITLLLILFVYIGYLIFHRAESDEEIPEGTFKWWDMPLFLVGIGIIIGSGHFFVEASSTIARHFGISEWVIGVTIVAVGTSAPEVATSLVALLRGQHGMSAGNLIGSDLFNLLGVLGLTAVLRPMTVAPAAWGSVILLAVMVTLVVFMMRTGWRLSRYEGAFLVVITAIRWVFEFSQ